MALFKPWTWFGKLEQKIFGSNGLDGAVQSFVNQYTRGSLTGAENEQNQFNAEQAQIARDYEERMSNTAYQRQVSDMKNAGVNPALMYSSGSSPASTPSGSPASGSAMSGLGMSDLMSAVSGAAKLKQELSLLGEEVKNRRAERRNKDAQTEVLNEQVGLTSAQKELALRQTERYDEITDSQLRVLQSQLDNDIVKRALDTAGISESESRTLLYDAQAMINSIDGKSRDEMNRLNMRLRIAEIALAYSNSAEARQRVEHLKADIVRIGNESLVLQAQEGKILNESYNLLIEQGILRETSKHGEQETQKRQFEIDHQKADRVWRNFGIAVGAASQLAGIGSAAATGIGAMRGASSLGSLASSAFARQSALQYAPANSFNPYVLTK